jgi:septal ring factor EnvC (AmiA/AmiB activator)
LVRSRCIADSHVFRSDQTDPLKPVELLPSPLHLESHPADELHAPDSPTTSLISSLRHQLTLLSDQAQQLNTKLVATISRHADLEDQHFHLQARHSELESSAETLRKEKAVWEERQRLAAGLVEEERRRGSAEEGRRQVENDVDDLAASLFDQVSEAGDRASVRACRMIGGTCWCRAAPRRAVPC